jgi:molybdenum cofactor cytidylyltransferase
MEPDSMDEMVVISAVILAAGASHRMGKPKMLLPWGNTVVIQKVVSILLDSGGYRPVIVTGRSAENIKRVIQEPTVIWAHNPDFKTTEMLISLQIGLRYLPEIASAFLVVLGDQPQIEANLIRNIITEFNIHRRAIIIPSYQFRRGHPWLVRTDLAPELLALPEDATMRDFLNAHTDSIDYLNVDTASVLLDLDTPEDYEQQKPPHTNEKKDVR